MSKFILLAAFVFFCASETRGACSGGSPTWTAASANSVDIQACVTAASNGDTILVPSGTVAFTAAVTIPSSKCLTINGQGAVTDTATSKGFQLTTSASCVSRITGFTFTGGTADGTNALIYVSLTSGGSGGTHDGGRIDHNTWTNATSATPYLYIINADGNPLLVDHNTFGPTSVSSSEMVHMLGAPLTQGGTTGWTNTVTPGGANMVFFEDNTWTGVNCGTSALQGYAGSQVAMRHNTFVSVSVDEHGTSGATPPYEGVRWFEMYSNTFNDNGVNMCYDFDLRSGSGVVFSNTVTNYGGGVNNIQMRTENSNTAPQAYQIGSGINGYSDGHNSCPAPSTYTTNSAPLYLWAKDPHMTYAPSGTVVLNRDIFESTSQPATMQWQEKSSDTCATTYTYSSYTYPHPLISGSGTVVLPTFSPVAGNYASVQTITLATITPSAILCFTTDGTSPTETANLCSGGTTHTYSAPIAVGSSETIKVLGTLSGFTDSAVATANYFIGTANAPGMFAEARR